MIVYSALYDEAILHFIGQWHLATEEARLRLEFATFRRAPEDQQDPGGLDWRGLHPMQFHVIRDYLPGVEHQPIQWNPTGWANLEMPLPAFPQGRFEEGFAEAFFESAKNPQPRPFAHHDGWQVDGTTAAPGQVIFLVNQQITLDDSDVLNLGNGPVPVIHPAIFEKLNHLITEGSATNPFDGLTMPHNVSDIAELGASARQIIDGLGEHSQDVVGYGPSLAGNWVNGAKVAEAPVLDDILPAPFQPQSLAATPAANHVSHAVDGEAPAGSLHLEAGANLLINSAVLQNAGLLGGVLAVNGDVYRLDVISQVNVLSDNDAGRSWQGQGADNTTLNYAAFVQQPAVYAVETAAGAVGGPLHWVVSVVQGDLIFTQWLKQTNFITDNDVHVLMETGATSNFVTGANYAHNITDFSQLGDMYDLILVGGHLYDINMILQLNVLLDDDQFLPGSENGATSDGNLLFNGATIVNAGAQNWMNGLPEHYLKALEQLGNGISAMPDGFGTDALFAGMSALRVLVVTGNIYDLHYISQTNVLGDADLVAAAEQAALAQASGNAQLWDISTGQNALINIAAIADTDAMGEQAYYGGTLYSDAVLIQSEILSGPEDDDWLAPQPLATEAIIFIASDDGIDTYSPDQNITPTASDGHSMDVMGSVLT